MNKIRKQFENFWKVYSLAKNIHKKDKQKMYRAFLDGYGLAIININDKEQGDKKWNHNLTPYNLKSQM